MTKLPPVKKPSAVKRWTIWYEDMNHPFTPVPYYFLEDARNEVKDLRDIGIKGPIEIYELVEIHRE